LTASVTKSKPKKKTAESTSGPSQGGGKKTHLKQEGRMEPSKESVCGWSLAGLLGLANKDGVVLGCSGKDCQRRHPKSLSELTRPEATEATAKWLASEKLKVKALSAILEVSTWRTA
jgi:hypothetical protein